MRRWMTWLVLLASVALVGCNGDQAGPELVTSEVLAEADLDFFWRLQLDLPAGERIARMHLLDENLYLLTDRNYLYTLDAASGRIKWSFRLSGPASKSFRPYHTSNLTLPERRLTIQEILSDRMPPSAEPFEAMLITTLTRLYVFDRSDGTVMRDIGLNFSANTGPACDGMSAFVGSSSELIHGIRLASATHLWDKPVGPMVAPPELTEGLLLVATEQGQLHCFRPGTSAEKAWTKNLNGRVSADFHADARGIFLGTDENFLYGLIPDSGRALWEPFITQGPINRRIQVGASTLFALAEGDRFYAVDLTSGKERWSTPDGRRVLGNIRGTVYLLDKDNVLHLMDEVLGTDRTALPLVGMDVFADNATAPAIYAASRDGGVYCLRPREAGQLTPEMLYRPMR